MWTQFFLENAHFAINIFAGMVFFAVFWLYYDAEGRSGLKGFLKLFGFLFLAISFLTHGTFIESSILPSGYFRNELFSWIFYSTKLLGYILIALGISQEPLQKHPRANLPLLFGKISLNYLLALFPLSAFAISISYLRRSTKGLERHLKSPAISFFILSLSEVLYLRVLFEGTSYVNIFKLTSSFGPLWLAEHVLLLFAVLILGKWVWGYLLRRLITQFFMIFTLASLIIFLFTTVSFSALLLKNIQDETLRKLETDVKVLNFALDAKKEEALSDALVLTQNTQVVTAISESQKDDLADILEDYLLTKGENTLVVVGEGGEVLGRGEDREKIGDSLSNDILIKRALIGEKSTSVTSKDAVTAAEISVRGAAPIKNEQGEVLGAVLTGTVIDNAFLDGIKRATGLEASIYSGNVLSATTLVSPDGKSRPIGIKEENTKVKDKVLKDGVDFLGPAQILGTPFFTAYLPLKDIDEVPVGMLFAGEPQVNALTIAGKSIEMTFIFAAFLIVFSILPSYLIAKYITKQVR